MNQKKVRIKKINWDKFSDILFNEDKHIYTLKGKRFTSCTQFLNKFKTNIFNEKFIENYCLKHDYDKEYIKKLWDLKREVGTTKGSELHFYVEALFKYNQTIPVSKNNTVEVDYFHKFLEDHQELECIHCEYILYDEELGIAGTIDGVFKNKNTGKYLIIDWKTNKEISSYNNTRFKNPISDLFQSDINIYSLQLGIYKYILEKNLNIEISDLWLVHFNSIKNNEYVKYELDYKKQSIEKMLNF